MKKAIIASMLVAATIFAACNNNSDNKNNSSSTSNTDTSKIVSAVKYACTMHPEVISDTPGYCPKCGMQMVPIKDSTKK
jgi:uncharacterized lipoprotein NlpE involved in copper resistance